MNFLFVHDHVLIKKNNNYYSAGGLSTDIFNRYLKENDKIYAYTRFIEKDDVDTKKLSLISGENIICIPSKYYNNSFDYYLNKKKIYDELNSILKNIDFCILRLPSFLGMLCLDVLKKNNTKYMIEMVACPWDSLWNYGGIKSKIYAPIMYYKTKKALKISKNVVYVTSEFLQNRYPTKGNSISISNVNINIPSNDILDKRLKRIKEKNKNDIYKIGFIGNLDNRIKGQETAILALKDILKENENFELHFLGNGNGIRLKKIIKELDLDKKIFFDGTLPGGEPVLNWLDDIDIFLLTSLQEGLPRCLIEAISRGCPSIATNAGGSYELIDNKYICKKKDYKSVSKKILNLVSNKEEMEKQAINNFNRAKVYDKTILNNKRSNFIKQCLK